MFRLVTQSGGRGVIFAPFREDQIRIILCWIPLAKQLQWRWLYAHIKACCLRLQSTRYNLAASSSQLSAAAARRQSGLAPGLVQDTSILGAVLRLRQSFQARHSCTEYLLDVHQTRTYQLTSSAPQCPSVLSTRLSLTLEILNTHLRESATSTASTNITGLGCDYVSAFAAEYNGKPNLLHKGVCASCQHARHQPNHAN